MNNRKILALLAAMTMMIPAASCGTDEEAIDTSGDTSVSSETDEAAPDSIDTENTAKTTASGKDSKKSDSKTTASSGESKSSGTATAKSSGGTAGGSKTTSGGSSGGESGSGGSSSGESAGDGSGGSSSGGSSGSSSGGSSSGGSSGDSSGGSSSGGGNSNSADDPAEEETSYDAEIKFSSKPSVSGNNVKTSGSVVTITAGGTYRITGSSSEGQICVDTATEEKVKIVLDGVDLTCSGGPALFINEAKKCIVELADGSTNKLRDTNKDKINDGVIFSNDTLRIKGSGKLEINAGNAHGIASDDDVIIEGGTYEITSVKSGIFAHDDITVSGGKLTVNGGTNGIKSKGTVNISGGTLLISGGTKEEKSSIYAGTALNYTGGYVYAAGNKVTAPAKSSNPYAVFALASDFTDPCRLRFYIDGTEQDEFLDTKNKFRCVLMMTPELKNGTEVCVSLNDKQVGRKKLSETKNVIDISLN